MAEMPPLLEETRENWGSRAGFVLAAIGSAVGLGNLWGFPYKLYKYGGGAFLIPYILAMLIIGVPVLILEFSLGHMSQRAAPEAFRRVGRRKEPVGWWGILLGFVIITYYPVILGWCLSFLGYSVSGILFHGGELPWAKTVEGAKKFFLFDYANVWKGDEGLPGWWPGSLSPHIVRVLLAVWGLMFVSIFRGVKVVSKIVLWTVPIPWLMLMILTVRGLTLPGASQGLAFYLNPDWGQLWQPDTWRWAFGQVFFSMSLAFGVMITYASFLHRKSDINNNATIIGLSDLGTSFVAGIAVFSTLGAMSLASGTAVGSVISTEGSGTGTVGLSFMVFPYALAQLPHSAWFGAVFFLALITLGIDSAFSITESVLASIVDKTGWNRTAVLAGMSAIGLACGLVYCSRGGLAWLEDIDGMINGPWGIALLGLSECLVLGWMFRLSRLRQHANERSDWKLGAWWDWNIRIFVPIVLAALLVWSIFDTVTNPSGYLVAADGSLKLPNIVGLGLAILAPVLAVLLSLMRTRSGPPEALRRSDEPVGDRQRPGALAALLGMAALLVGVALTAVNIATRNALYSDAKMSASMELAWGVRPFWFWLAAVVGLVLAVGSLAAGIAATGRAERQGRRPHWTQQFAGVAGVLTVGTLAGMAIALLSMQNRISHHKVAHVAEMHTAAYVILAVMIGLLVVGLGWCFYRAMLAAKSGADEAQTTEI